MLLRLDAAVAKVSVAAGLAAKPDPGGPCYGPIQECSDLPDAQAVPLRQEGNTLNSIVYIVGAVVIVLAILSFLGFR